MMRSYKCMRCLLQESTPTPRWPGLHQRRALSTTQRSLANVRKPQSITAAKMGLLEDEEAVEAEGSDNANALENYQHIREYTPIQQEAINLAHKALVENVDQIRRPQKIKRRRDPGAPLILKWEDKLDPQTGERVAIREDFAKVDPFLDPVDYREMMRRSRGLGDQLPDFASLEMKSEEEMGSDLRVWLDRLLEPIRETEKSEGHDMEIFQQEVEKGNYEDNEAGLDRFFAARAEIQRRRVEDQPLSGQEWFQFLKEQRLLKGDEVAEKGALSSLAPEIGDWSDPKFQFPEANQELPEQLRLRQQVLLTKDELRKIMLKPLVQHRVVNQTHMGKIDSIYCLSIAGNGNGLIGIGEGKAAEPDDARKQADLRAIRNMEPVHRYEERTIFGEVKGKVGATELVLMSRPPGFGVRTQSLIFEIARICGITDLAARVTRSRNKMNTVKATLQALKKQRLPEEIARARGKKLVDVRKVYYAGLV